jgi:hypothetical protein
MRRIIFNEQHKLIPGKERHTKYIPDYGTVFIENVGVQFLSDLGTIYLPRWAGEYYYGISWSNPDNKYITAHISYEYEDSET